MSVAWPRRRGSNVEPPDGPGGPRDIVAHVVAAPDPASIRAMMTPYLHELTPGASSLYPRLELYWEDPDRLPYVIRVGVEDVGFALVRDHMEARLHEMAEFYVERAWRRLGVGRHAVSALFERHPGFWHLQILEDNVVARAFWRSVVPPPADETRHVAANGRRFVVMQFRAGATVPRAAR
ncbi:MAG TPA: GNAT family N-acetyltransferase [Casimicrobiaceae bacterium]|nr:GNAT family N-acetyltransferase [Casimicrobiaceae bacterium]